jgi:gamma-glutamylaminecyclotransferase
VTNVSDHPTDDRRFILFVYGTLLSSEPSHNLLGDSRALGPTTTAPSFDLFDLGVYPALVAGGTTAIAGELYELTARVLATIDVHEGVPLLFKRKRIALADGREAEAYLLEADQVRGRRRIRSGDWRARFQPPPSSAPSARDTPFVSWVRKR